MDDELINRAKSYAKKRGKSLSQIVAGYFSLLDAEPDKASAEFSPLVRSLKGSLRGAKVSRKDYYKYLEEKYL